MKKLIVLVSLFCILISSCKFGPYTWDLSEDNVEDRVKNIQKLEGEYLPSQTNGSSTYSFLIVTDMHFGAQRYTHDDEGFFEWFTNQLNSADPSKVPQFIVNLGDIADMGRKQQFKDYYSWCQKVKQIAKDQAGFDDYKIYAIPGNHDLYNDGQDFYKDWVYPNIYSYYFDFTNDTATNGFEFVFLDSANGSIGVNQMKSFQETMPLSKRPKIIFSHYPVYAGGAFIMDMQDTLERAKILTICGENNSKLLLEGHVHKNQSFDYGKGFFEQVTTSYAQHNGLNLVTVNEAEGTVTTKQMSF